MSVRGRFAAMPGWQRTLWLMVALQFTISMSRSVSFPFMPLFLIEIGVHPVAQVELWAGAITSIGFLLAAITAPIWGSVADRTGRKAMVLRSSVSICLFNGLLGLATAAWQIFALRAVTGIFTGFGAAAMALVGTQVPEESLGFSLGWMATGQLVGNLIGPLIGGFMADRLHDYRLVFFITSAVSLLACLACSLLVHEDRSSWGPVSGRERVPMWKQLHTLALHPGLAPMFMVVLLAQVCALGVTPILPLLVATLIHGGPHLATFAGAAVAVTGVADVIASPWLGKRSDRIGYRRILLISLAGAACFTLPQAFAGTIWVFLALRFGVGAFVGGILPTANAWIGRMFPREQRGQVYGLTSSATLLGQSIGPMVGGGLAARFGMSTVFVVIGTLMLANLLWVATSVRTEPGTTGR